MIKNENILSKLLIITAVILLLVFGYLYSLLDEIEVQYTIMAIFTLINIITLAYKQSSIYKKKNNIKNLIKREGEWLVCQSSGINSPSIIVIDKIGEIRISMNYLSFIEIGHGQGYGFEVKAHANVIMTHLSGLLKPEEIKEMKLDIV
ncbi:hypothetical protein CJF42_05640 [Pseudoalteromonas sp. NBT06-2]|nr:hypothetical protein CJF42_05640 [Pseudoalteromonas sp. NBT06-2]